MTKAQKFLEKLKTCGVPEQCVTRAEEAYNNNNAAAVDHLAEVAKSGAAPDDCRKINEAAGSTV